MKTLQASEAKTNFLRLLDDVEAGETIVITRHGKPVARLVPDSGIQQSEIVKQAWADIDAFRKRAPKVSVEEILEWRDEGRK